MDCLSNNIELYCLIELSEIKISDKEIYMILIWKIEGYGMMSQRLVSGQPLTSKLVSQTENRPIVLVFPKLQIKVYTLHIKIYLYIFCDLILYKESYDLYET